MVLSTSKCPRCKLFVTHARPSSSSANCRFFKVGCPHCPSALSFYRCNHDSCTHTARTEHRWIMDRHCNDCHNNQHHLQSTSASLAAASPVTAANSASQAPSASLNNTGANLMHASEIKRLDTLDSSDDENNNLDISYNNDGDIPNDEHDGISSSSEGVFVLPPALVEKRPAITILFRPDDNDDKDYENDDESSETSVIDMFNHQDEDIVTSPLNSNVTSTQRPLGGNQATMSDFSYMNGVHNQQYFAQQHNVEFGGIRGIVKRSSNPHLSSRFFDVNAMSSVQDARLLFKITDNLINRTKAEKLRLLSMIKIRVEFLKVPGPNKILTSWPTEMNW